MEAITGCWGNQSGWRPPTFYVLAPRSWNGHQPFNNERWRDRPQCKEALFPGVPSFHRDLHAISRSRECPRFQLKHPLVLHEDSNMHCAVLIQRGRMMGQQGPSSSSLAFPDGSFSVLATAQGQNECAVCLMSSDIPGLLTSPVSGIILLHSSASRAEPRSPQVSAPCPITTPALTPGSLAHVSQTPKLNIKSFMNANGTS